MKKLLVLVALLMLSAMLVYCLGSIVPGTTPTPEEKPTPPDPTPSIPPLMRRRITIL